MTKSLKDKIQAKLFNYFSQCQYPVIAAYLFGSYAQEMQRHDSDIDVAVFMDESNREKRFDAGFRMMVEIARTLKIESVDICLLQDERNRMAFNALKNGMLVFCTNDEKRLALEAEIIKRHIDLEDFESIHKYYLYRRIKGHRMGEGSIDMLNRSAVEERLDYIDQMLTKLKSYKGMSLDDFRNDDTIYHAALYELQTCLEAVTDIAAHLVNALCLGVPEDRPEAFTMLSQSNILSETLAERLGDAVGMRNVIVHGYLHIALNLVYRAIQSELRDIEDFCEAVKRYIDESE